MSKCLYCYKELKEGEKDFHAKCAMKIFGQSTAPNLPYNRTNLEQLAKIVINSRTTVTGVQEKLSLDLDRTASGEPSRLTIVGALGRYILKPQTEKFMHLPETEDVVMHLADDAHIRTVPHCLIRFNDGELCYLTKRIDRTIDGKKLYMEDFCQLSEQLTEQKYQSSYEHIATLIKHYSESPMLDLVNFWEQVLFAWIVGNADMHLKNFSLYRPQNGKYQLAPTYDQVSTALVMPEDSEELALYLNGFKRNLLRTDFEQVMENSGLDTKVIGRLIEKLISSETLWKQTISNSFLPDSMQETLIQIISQRIARLKQN